jgi:pyrimidine operon attenuation protein/uracil phosphoribosyltransferase
MTRPELAQSLRRTASNITREAVEQELSDTIPPNDLVGIEVRLATTLGRLAQELEDSAG